MMTYEDVFCHSASIEANELLEALIDRESLGDVLGCIAAIAGEKADHIRSNWGDKALAADWDKAADKLAETAENLSI